jgi:hypothetical protein
MQGATINTACEMFLMYAVIAVFNSFGVRGRSRYTADFATYHSLSAQRLSERILYKSAFQWNLPFRLFLYYVIALK